jgi:hypothetical protein
MQGRPLTPLLLAPGRGAMAERPSYLETWHTDMKSKRYDVHQIGMVGGGRKVIIDLIDAKVEMYDLLKDPKETDNLFYSAPPALRAELLDMAGQLVQAIDELGPHQSDVGPALDGFWEHVHRTQTEDDCENSRQCRDTELEPIVEPSPCWQAGQCIHTRAAAIGCASASTACRSRDPSG